MNNETVTREILREELAGYATKEDLADVKVELIGTITEQVGLVLSKFDFVVEQASGDRVDALETEVRDHETRISNLES